jgi:2-keto-3-deoxy-L-rhamnonate aldolase RhmA
MAEVLSLTDLDLFCIDTEHAPFGRLELDLCVASFRAADRPCLVRVADDSPKEIRNALDSGATGLLVPHVTSADQAAAIVKAAHFGEGGRGFAGSSRAANFTTKSMSEHLAESREQTALVLQIEDLAALANVADIAAVEGVDCLFVGRADLAVAMQKNVMDNDVIEQVQQICKDARSNGAAVGMYTPALDELPEWRDQGASLFLLSSDQSFVLAGANALAKNR